MYLTLTTQWIEHKQSIQTKELQDGMKIEYYGNSVADCDFGIIIEKDGVFMIDWENISEPTIIDGSDKANMILTRCGFSN